MLLVPLLLMLLLLQLLILHVAAAGAAATVFAVTFEAAFAVDYVAAAKALQEIFLISNFLIISK